MLPSTSVDSWPELLSQTLRSYDETLVRKVGARLCRPRSQWPVSDLIDRCLEVLQNPPVLDRRLKEQEPAARQALALMGRSRQPRWPVGNLVEMLTALGHGDGLAPVQALLEAGLLFPVLSDKTRLKRFDAWLGQGVSPVVQAPPAITQRVLAEPLPLDFSESIELQGTVHEADGLDWPLRLAALWQQLHDGPLRRTQQRDLFKRDLDRLKNDPLLATPPTDALTELPDPGLFIFALGLAAGVIEEIDGDLRAATFPAAWGQDTPTLLVALLASVFQVEAWNPVQGWAPSEELGNPYPSAQLLALMALTALPDGQWARPAELEKWIFARHPYWATSSSAKDTPPRSGRAKNTAEVTGIACFLLGIAYPLRLLQACKDADGAWAVRLSPMGRALLGSGEPLPKITQFPQALLVQPNLEILAYRQGLTPELLVKLTRFAAWRTLGAACTLQLEPASVYRALEAGDSQTSIAQTLQRHAMKPTPAPVLEALKTWSNKHERISVYPSAVVLEFASNEDLQAALARGLPAVQLAERLAAVANESQIDFKHFRLTGTRDYCLPPERCVDVESDGVTLSLDLARTDLMLETELQRFAEPAEGNPAPGRRGYRLTPASLAAARAQGFNVAQLGAWFEQRTGLPLSPAARLLFSAGETPPPEFRRRLVLQVESADIGDGLMQWPATAGLIQARLGPTSLAVAEHDVPRLLEIFGAIGMRVSSFEL